MENQNMKKIEFVIISAVGLFLFVQSVQSKEAISKHLNMEKVKAKSFSRFAIHATWPSDEAIKSKKDFLRLHHAEPVFMCRRQIFDDVEFDGRYDWYYEWLDFFFQCFNKDKKIYGTVT